MAKIKEYKNSNIFLALLGGRTTKKNTLLWTTLRY
jgi:hypothetical protein